MQTVLPLKVLGKDPLFSWCPPENLRFFANCFDLEVMELPTGSTCFSNGRLGYLMSGDGVLTYSQIDRSISAGILFGVSESPSGKLRPCDVALEAKSNSTILWMDADCMTSVCYRACWFHDRFILEAKPLLFIPSQETVPPCSAI